MNFDYEIIPVLGRRDGLTVDKGVRNKSAGLYVVRVDVAIAKNGIKQNHGGYRVAIIVGKGIDVIGIILKKVLTHFPCLLYAFWFCFLEKLVSWNENKWRCQAI